MEAGASTVERLLRSARHWTTWIVSPEARRHAKVGPATMWREKRAFQIEFLRSHGLRPDQQFLDVGCGTLRGGIPIISYLEPGHYTGIEARPEILEDAWAEVRRHHLEDRRPELIASGDLGTLELGRRFDVIWAFAVLIHMSDDVLASALTFVHRHLGSEGVFYATITTEQRSDKCWNGFPDVARPVSFYAEHAAAADLSVESLGTLRALGHPPGPGEHQQMLRFTRVAA